MPAPLLSQVIRLVYVSVQLGKDWPRFCGPGLDGTYDRGREGSLALAEEWAYQVAAHDHVWDMSIVIDDG